MFDDDGDGLADYPVDPGCTSPFDNSERLGTACDNSINNDGDYGLGGQPLVDWGGGDGRQHQPDPDCINFLDNSELGDSGPPTCDNDLDDDGDGLTDYGSFSTSDPGCNSRSDSTETADNYQCGDGIDNDGDTYEDYNPNDPYADPGCTSRKDKNELGTVQCDNGLDDDGDNSTDYPDDTYCTSPAGEFEANPLCGDPPQPCK